MGTGFLLFMLQLALLGGCARNMPVFRPVAAGEQEHLRQGVAAFQSRKSPASLDMDLHLSWRRLTTAISFPLTLQMEPDGRLRVAGLDPLARPFFILVASQEHFLLVDNRRGRAYRGSLPSRFLGRYLPEEVTPELLFPLLTARLPDGADTPYSLAEPDREERRWLEFSLPNRWHLQVLFDREWTRILRQRLLDRNGEAVIDVAYEGFREVEAGLWLPRQLEARGTRMPGTLTLVLERWYPHRQLSSDLFRLAIPEHFPVTRVE